MKRQKWMPEVLKHLVISSERSSTWAELILFNPQRLGLRSLPSLKLKPQLSLGVAQITFVLV